MNKNIFLLIIIIFLGAVIRIWSLGSTNLGFFRDEAALGFNTWSILTTGADEYGQKLPIFFRSFEVFFMPLFVYLSVPIMFFFGLTEFSTRALSAISGTVLIFLAYLIGKILFSTRVGIFAATIVAFSPWAIFFSRGAFEGNLALMFFTLGFYLWLKFVKEENNKYFLISLLTFVLSMYSYQAPRIAVPLFIIVSIFLTKNWKQKIKLWIMGFIFVVILYAPVLLLLNSAAGHHRAVGVSIFANNQSFPGYSDKLGQWQNIYLYPK